MRMMLAWGEGDTAGVSSQQELDARLDQLAEEASAAGKPTIVTMYDDNDAAGPTLSIGVGGEHSVATWQDTETGYSWSSAGASEEEFPVAEFLFGGESSEIPQFALIPNDQARDAARQFLTTGERPANITWQEV